MVFAVASAVARRRLAVLATQNVQRRKMGSAPAQNWTGVDKIVRDVFPQDYQLAMAIMGGYMGLFVLYKIKSAIGGKAIEEPVAAPTSSGPSTGVPSVDSPEFDTFVGSDAFNKLLDSEEQLGKVIADMK